MCHTKPAQYHDHFILCSLSEPHRLTLPPHSFPTRRSSDLSPPMAGIAIAFHGSGIPPCPSSGLSVSTPRLPTNIATTRSEEHTSELQSRGHLVCRLLLEKKN